MTAYTKVWLTGPSGSGKSHVLTEIRQQRKGGTFDLDFVGYRPASEGGDEWHIPLSIFGVLNETAKHHKLFVAAGCGSEPDALYRSALRFGFRPVVVLPTVEELRKFRIKRGDEPEKVEEAAESLEKWARHASNWNAAVIGHALDILRGVEK